MRAGTLPVSVVIPCYNAGEYLAETLDSLARQSRPVQEVIIVDDGSTDPATVALLRDLAGRGQRVITLPENRGLPAARNAGIAAATGEYIFPLDADDLLHPECLLRLTAALQRDPQLMLAYPQIVVMGEKQYLEVKPRQYDFYHLLFENYICGNSLFRRVLWEKLGGYDETMRQGYEDWEFWIRAGKAGNCGRFVPDALFYYRRRPGNLLQISHAYHAALCGYLQRKHADVYNEVALRALKARWRPPTDYELRFGFPRLVTANHGYEWRRRLMRAVKALLPDAVKRALVRGWTVLRLHGRGISW